MRSWYFAAVVMAVAVLAPGAAAAAAGQTADDLFESATEVSGLSVVVERTSARLVAGQDTGYTIGVKNEGERSKTVRVRVTVPPWMPEVTPHDGGELGGGFVEWPVTVAPGQVTIMRMTGAYAAPDRNAPTRVAFTACAVGTSDDRPIVCATDIAKLESARSGTNWWLPALGGLAGLAVLVAAGGAALWFFVLRRRRPGPPPPPPPAEQRQQAPVASAA